MPSAFSGRQASGDSHPCTHPKSLPSANPSTSFPNSSATHQQQVFASPLYSDDRSSLRAFCEMLGELGACHDWMEPVSQRIPWLRTRGCSARAMASTSGSSGIFSSQTSKEYEFVCPTNTAIQCPPDRHVIAPGKDLKRYARPSSSMVAWRSTKPRHIPTTRLDGSANTCNIPVNGCPGQVAESACAFSSSPHRHR
jgi:hypothetical protein